MTPPPFGTFPKIHSLWYQNPSLDRVNISQLKYNFFSFKIPFYICAVNVKNNRCCWTNTKYCCTNNLFCKTNACKQTLQAHLWSWKPEICSSVKCSAMLKAEVRPRSWENCWKLSIYFWFVLFCPDPGIFFLF